MQLLIANWKAHKSQAAVVEWFSQFRQTLMAAGRTAAPSQAKRQVVIAPAAFLLPSVAAEIAQTQELVESLFGAKLSLGVQDVSHLSAGSYTGAIAAVHLPQLGVTHCIVGHSERRTYFKETNQDVVGKVDQVLDAGMVPVVCVDSAYTQSQIMSFQREWLNRLVFAFEPISAIGSGQSASLELVKKEVTRIRELAGQVNVLYGGSINDRNIGEYLLVSDGGLVGTASVEGTTFAQLLLAAW